MSCFQILPVGNSFVLQWGTSANPVKNSVTGVTDVGATVSVTLVDSEGAEVSGQSWPANMAHAGVGIYRTTLSSAINLAPGASYVAVIDAIGSGLEVGRLEIDCVAETRKR